MVAPGAAPSARARDGVFAPAAVEELDVTECADALVDVVTEARRVGARRLALAAHWADLHGPDKHGWGRATRMGDGLPDVDEFAATELGALVQTSTRSAEILMRDALELRHRLPRLWAAVLAGEVEDWKARKVAAATRVLTANQARWVDAETVDAVLGLPFGRALTVVEGKVVAADPAGHDARRRKAEEERYVALGRRSGTGLRTLVAQTTAGDVARLDAMVEHLADLLGQGGDVDPRQVRRAKALGLLANPALACVVLARQAAAQEPLPGVAPDPDPDPAPATPVELARELGRALLAADADGRRRVVDRLRPRTVLYLHLAEEAVQGRPGTQVVRAEGLGAVSREELQAWLGTDRLEVRPVLDVAGQLPVDAYEVPSRLEEAVLLSRPFEVFPFGTLPARGADLDHTRPYGSGESGETAWDNLGPLGRRHHRAKTIGGFTCHQPLPGVYLWRVPSGHWFRVDHTGTTALGTAVPELLRSREGPTLEVRLARRLELALGA